MRIGARKHEHIDACMRMTPSASSRGNFSNRIYVSKESRGAIWRLLPPQPRRYATLTMGSTTCDTTVWNKIKQLEEERRTRTAA